MPTALLGCGGCGSDSRSLFASLTPHPAANGIIVIHKQDFMRN
jgi:hypothetical protein